MVITAVRLNSICDIARCNCCHNSLRSTRGRCFKKALNRRPKSSLASCSSLSNEIGNPGGRISLIRDREAFGGLQHGNTDAVGPRYGDDVGAQVSDGGHRCGRIHFFHSSEIRFRPTDVHPSLHRSPRLNERSPKESRRDTRPEMPSSVFQRVTSPNLVPGNDNAHQVKAPADLRHSAAWFGSSPTSARTRKRRGTLRGVLFARSLRY